MSKELETRDIAWYKAKSKEINDLRQGLFSTDLIARMALNSIISMIEANIANTRPMPRFKDGCAKIKEGSQELIIQPNNKVIKHRPRHATSLSRMRCNM